MSWRSKLKYKLGLATPTDLAILDYTEAIRTNPADATNYWFRGVAYAMLNQWPAARRDWERGAELDPDGPAGENARIWLCRSEFVLAEKRKVARRAYLTDLRELMSCATCCLMVIAVIVMLIVALAQGRIL
ncbi:unnamed protein product, partial [marine sediment metagenome]